MSKSEQQRIETKLNFKDIELDCYRRGISVHDYFHEYAERLFKLYLQWKREGLGKGTTVYDAKTMEELPVGKEVLSEKKESN